MSSVNKVILIGRLGKDPESKSLPSGEAVTNFSVATSESWKDRNGHSQERTEWHNIVTFRKVAEIAAQYLKKGSHVYIEGSIRTRKWQDQSGADRYTTEIVCGQMKMLGSKGDSGQEEYSQPAKQAAPAQAPAPDPFSDFDQDLSF